MEWKKKDSGKNILTWVNEKSDSKQRWILYVSKEEVSKEGIGGLFEDEPTETKTVYSVVLKENNPEDEFNKSITHGKMSFRKRKDAINYAKKWLDRHKHYDCEELWDLLQKSKECIKYDGRILRHKV